MSPPSSAHPYPSVTLRQLECSLTMTDFQVVRFGAKSSGCPPADLHPRSSPTIAATVAARSSENTARSLAWSPRGMTHLAPLDPAVRPMRIHDPGGTRLTDDLRHARVCPRISACAGLHFAEGAIDTLSTAAPTPTRSRAHAEMVWRQARTTFARASAQPALLFLFAGSGLP